MEKFSDIRLLELIRKGNNHAFTALVNRYWENLYTHVYARLRHEEDSKDIVQEIFISVYKNIHTLSTDNNDTIASYLYKAARYSIIDHYSKPQTAIYDEDLLRDSLSSLSTAHELLVSKELEQELDEVLNSMPERLQLPYRLSRHQHLSTREIASRLSVSEQTVKNNISITLRYLRSHFNEQNGVAGLVIIYFIIP
jgi:RNA polymerase sigma factor (sigma-70 family)